MRQAPLPCTVLFVDDEPRVLEGLQDALRRYPITILTAPSAAHALTLLDAAEVDVVVSDERMPQMTGSEFLGVVRQRHPHIIRIILTGQASLTSAIHAINEGGVYRFLTKPFSAAQLAAMIQQALHARNAARSDDSASARGRKHARALRDLEGEHPGISEIKRSVDGAIVVEDTSDVDELVLQVNELSAATDRAD